VQHHIDRTTSIHNLIGITEKSYTSQRIIKIFHTTILLETQAREIKARVVFDERQKHDLNLSINPYLKEEVNYNVALGEVCEQDLYCRPRLDQTSRGYPSSIYNHIR